MARHSIASLATSVCCATLIATWLPSVWAEQTAQSQGGSKKGLQVQMVDDALALGVHHAAINVSLAQLAALKSDPDNESIIYQGTRVEFNKRAVEALDSKIQPLHDHGVTVYLILLAYNTANPDLAHLFIHPKFNAVSKAPISAFKIDDAESARELQACVTFLTQRYALKNLPPLHFIVGNEVNSHWFWYNMGESTMDEVVVNYERAVRLCFDAAHTVSSNSRVYLSLDHHWNSSVTPHDSKKSFGGRAFLDAFAKLAKRNGEFEWHLAFHPYPENLFEARTWNDHDATLKLDTPKITFKNIELLNDYMKRPELAFNGKPRRIILSEQGFHTTNSPDGEVIHAAAFAYAYRKVEQLDGIDAFILHRHVDHLKEGGLHLGLWTCDKDSRPAKKKVIYEVFRRADTAEWKQAFQFALPTIGVETWEGIQ